MWQKKRRFILYTKRNREVIILNLLLFLFAIPFATIILSIILQKLINNSILVAFATFSVFIIIAVITMNETYFILTIVYAILSYIAAVTTQIIEKLRNRCISSQDSISNNYISNEYTNNSCDKSDIVIEKNSMNKRYWR